jgi:hypothetical protein
MESLATRNFDARNLAGILGSLALGIGDVRGHDHDIGFFK